MEIRKSTTIISGELSPWKDGGVFQKKKLVFKGEWLYFWFDFYGKTFWDVTKYMNLKSFVKLDLFVGFELNFYFLKANRSTQKKKRNKNQPFLSHLQKESLYAISFH